MATEWQTKTEGPPPTTRLELWIDGEYRGMVISSVDSKLGIKYVIRLAESALEYGSEDEAKTSAEALATAISEGVIG